jgi:hypothetical protein
MLAGEFFARLALGTRAVGMRAMRLHRVDLEFAPTRVNRNDWPCGANVSCVRLRVYEDVALRWQHACDAGKPAGGAFPIDKHASKKARHAHRIVLDAPCTQLVPLLPLMIRVAPFAD